MVAPNLLTNSDRSNLALAFSHVCRLIAEITAHPQPNYTEAGRTYSWASYLSLLVEQRGAIKRAMQDEDCPFIVVTRGSC